MILAANRIPNESLGASRRVLTNIKIMLVFQSNVLKHSCFLSLPFLIDVTFVCFTEIRVLSSQISRDSQVMQKICGQSADICASECYKMAGGLGRRSSQLLLFLIYF